MMRFAPFIAFALLCVVLAFKLLSPVEPNIAASPMVGRALPTLQLKGLGGEAVLLPKGTFMINFFASWCLPCQQEMPELKKIAAIGTLPIIGVAWKNKPADAAAWLSKLGNPYMDIMVDEAGTTTVPFGLTGVPETFIVRDGVIVYHSKSLLVADEIKQWLEGNP